MLAAFLTTSGPRPAFAAVALDGASLSLWWLLPFAGTLASLAIFPTAAPRFWHRRQGIVSAFWIVVFLAPFSAVFGTEAAFHELAHALIIEYIPFILLIGSLFAIAGGIYIGGEMRGSPAVNAALLACGTAIASVAGTTGAAMIFIRPLLRANRHRKYKVHLAVFFIVLVCNIGGALTPLGDPPLFLGYLNGVSFFWPFKALWLPTLIVFVIVIAVFVVLDAYLIKKEGTWRPRGHSSTKVHVGGLINLPLIGALMAAVAVSGTDGLGTVSIFGTTVNAMGLARDGILVALAAISMAITPRQRRDMNEFTWAPVAEVAKLFAAIFITVGPAIAILKAGQHGQLAFVLNKLGTAEAPNNQAYFWLTGVLSSFLDNAPTYVVFFNAAGGDAQTLMGPMSQTLTAISAGAVFMGAMTYIGNAPNFMVKAMAERQGVAMPSFFGYLAWSSIVLLPALLIVSLLFFL